MTTATFNGSKLMTSIEALETSIYWQNYVLKETKDPAQRQRCIAAIEKLMAQLKQAQSQA